MRRRKYFDLNVSDETVRLIRITEANNIKFRSDNSDSQRWLTSEIDAKSNANFLEQALARPFCVISAGLFVGKYR